jgi:hypothetical protein
MEAIASAPHGRSAYQGGNLLRLLLAFGVPAFVLFLRIVLAIAASSSRVTTGQVAWLNRASYAILPVFFVLELFCARYVQRLLRPARTPVVSALQYVGVLALCLFFSVCGAIGCEAFGYALFLRVAQR